MDSENYAAINPDAENYEEIEDCGDREMYRDRPGHREPCTTAPGRPIQRNVAEDNLIDVIMLDENSINIDFKFHLNFSLKIDLQIDLKIELITENSAHRNFELMLFRANRISWSCFFFSEIRNFGSMGFGIMRP